MTKEEFYKKLEATDLFIPEKFEVCKYFLENYPVEIDESINTPIGNVKTGRRIWSKIDIKIKDSSNAIIESNFDKLVKRIDEIKKFDNGK